MRILIRAESIVPGMSGGIEHFTAGLLSGLTEVLDAQDTAVVAVARGTEREWANRVAPTRRVAYLPVASTASIGHATAALWRSGALRRGREWATGATPGGALLRRLRARVDANIAAKVEPSIVYYPYHLDEVRTQPAVVTIHDLRQFQPHLESARRTTAVLRQNAMTADAVVTSWPHPFLQLTDVFPNLRDRAFTIPFPVMNPPLAMPAARPPEAAYMLYPAATAGHKNHIALIEALPEVRRRHTVRLVCTGALISPAYDEAVVRAAQLGVTDIVDFRGFVSREELDGLYRGAAAVVIPSLWEAASGPIFEAFAYGRPVACSDVPPIRSQVDLAGATVAFFDPGDPRSIASAIDSVLLDPTRFERGSSAGGAWLASMSWGRTALDYLRVWRWVSDGRSLPPPMLSSGSAIQLS